MKKQVDETPKNDIMFKEIFSDEEILKDFLEALLNEKIENIDIEQDFNIRGNIHQKIGILDIKAEINGEKIVQIEMQKKNKYNMEQRTIFYGSKVVSKLLKKGDTYSQLKPIILINILNYNLIKLPEYYTKTRTVAENYNEYELIKGIKYGFIELTKFRKTRPNLNKKLDQWLIFLDNKNKELLKMVTEKNKIIAKAEEKRQYLTGDAERERLQELREKAEFDEASAYEAGRKIGEKYGQKIGQKIGQEIGQEIGEERGIKIGEKRGRKAMSIETARGMLKDKLDKNLITKYTGLTSEEIEAIAL